LGQGSDRLSEADAQAERPSIRPPTSPSDTVYTVRKLRRMGTPRWRDCERFAPRLAAHVATRL